MAKSIKIVVADTNWWVSLLIKNYNNRFASVILSPVLQFVTSRELTEEIAATLQKERLQKLLNTALIQEFWQQFGNLVTTITVTSLVSVCRDPNDNFLLALAKDAEADFLITGDKDLLVLEKFEKTVICTLSTFIEEHFKPE